LDAVGNKVETALMSHAPKIVWKREAIATELKIPARRPRPATLSVEQMAAVLESLKTPHLFRFAIMSLCTWARPQAIIDFDPATQVDWNGGLIDLAPIGWVPTKKRRPRQPLTGCLAGWLPVWNKEDEARRAAALAADRTPPELGLIVYKGKRVATVKRAFRRIGAELGLMGFSQYSLRHFMADQIKKLFRNVPREQRSLWMGHVVRDGSRTTANYESDDPEMLADVALPTDCVIALIQQHCGRPLFAVDVLLTKKDLHAIGARVIPEMLRKQRVGGGRDRDRTNFGPTSHPADLPKIVLKSQQFLRYTFVIVHFYRANHLLILLRQGPPRTAGDRHDPASVCGRMCGRDRESESPHE
jgi:hypothetical protein